MYVILLFISAIYGPVLAIVAVLGAAALVSPRARAAIRHMIVGD